MYTAHDTQHVLIVQDHSEGHVVVGCSSIPSTDLRDREWDAAQRQGLQLGWGVPDLLTGRGRSSRR